MELRAVFVEVSDILENQHSSNGEDKNSNATLDLKCAYDKKEMSEIILPRQECHRKDASTCALQRAYREVRVSVLRDLLSTDELMLVFCKPDYLKDSVVPSKAEASID